MRSRAAGLLVVTVLAIAGCGAQVETGGNPMPTSSGSGRSPSAEPPGRSPGPPPKVGPSTPSDYNPGDVVTGRVVKGGSGPCYTVVDDDNRRYALHNDAGLTLEEGSYVRATVAPLRAKIDCGPGAAYELVSVKRL